MPFLEKMQMEAKEVGNSGLCFQNDCVLWNHRKINLKTEIWVMEGFLNEGMGKLTTDSRFRF